MMVAPVLNIDDLHLGFEVPGGEVHAVRGVSLFVNAGETLALVGESGCGKSSVAQAIMGLNPTPPTRIHGGRIEVCGQDVAGASEKDFRSIRGSAVSMVFQDASACLDPTMKIGRQITEALVQRKDLSAKTRKAEALRLLPDATTRMKQYPHELSGGMKQRVMIAIALANDPQLLIADEPTSALDVTIQLQILLLLKQIQQTTQTAILLITHDLGVVAQFAERMAVMYAGKLVEQGMVCEVLEKPAHPYTQGLIACLPQNFQTKEHVFIPGSPPDLFTPPIGCSFAPRCSKCMQICIQEEPPEYDVAPDHSFSCWLHHPSAAQRGRA
ncbi:MAG: ABC transporter ATP-binding protein [Raoultibacter sp.]